MSTRPPDPTIPDTMVRPIPSVGPSRDSRGDFPLPRFISDILIGMLVVGVAAAVVMLIANSPPVLPLAALSLGFLWLIGMFTRWVAEDDRSSYGDRPIPPPPAEE